MSKANDHAVEISNLFIAALEEGTAPWISPVGAKSVFTFPVNFTTKKTYNGRNIGALLANQAKFTFPTSEYLTFNQAKAMGLKLKEGSKGMHARAAYFSTFTPKSKKDEEGDNKVPFCNLKPLWNISLFVDEDGVAADVMAPIKRTDVADTLKAFTGQHGITLMTGSTLGASYFYNDQTGIKTINVTSYDLYQSESAYLSSLTHECMHASLSNYATDLRKDVVSFCKDKSLDAYAVEEIIVEMATAIFLSARGIQISELQSIEYIGSWIESLKAEPTLLAKVCDYSAAICEHVSGFEVNEDQTQIAA